MKLCVCVLLVGLCVSADPSSPPTGTSPVTPSTTANTGINAGVARPGGLIAESDADSKPVVAAIQVNMHRSRMLRPEPDNPTAKVGRFTDWGYMNVLLELSGNVVSRAVRVGNLRVGLSRDDKGKDLLTPPAGGGGSSHHPMSMNRLDFRNLTPAEQMACKLNFSVHQMAPSRGAESLSLFGSIDLVLGGQRKSLELGTINPSEEAELSHPELTKMGIKLTLTKPPAGYTGANRKDTVFAVKVRGGDALLLGFETRDANGMTTEANPFGFQGLGEHRVQLYRFPSPQGTKLPLLVVVQAGAELLTVPFDLKDIPAP